LADHNGCSLGPIGIDQLGVNPVFREFIHNSADSPLYVSKVLLGDLNPWIVLAHNHNPDTLLSSLGIAKLPSLPVAFTSALTVPLLL
jgi:hypothetical protein